MSIGNAEFAVNSLSRLREDRPPNIQRLSTTLSEAIPGTDIAEGLEEALRSLQLRLQLSGTFGSWDHDPEPDWADSTPPGSQDRRALVYSLMGVDDDLAQELDRALPVVPAPVVIEGRTGSAVTWPTSGGWYWPRLAEKLNDDEWEENSARSLHLSSQAVVEHFPLPGSDNYEVRRGLVVGYVQSGKTANMMAVAAKAVDAGYRLIIILSGQTNLLRSQTQRRIDRDVIRRELIPSEEYPGDDDIASYGGRPSDLGASADWFRLTDSLSDFDTERNVPSRDQAALAVVKKRKENLEKLNRFLATNTVLGQTPALVIDDESDYASVNTKPPERDETSTINRLIRELLEVLPAANYVAYTATPWANVFIDPEVQDLFPKDFVYPLPKPSNYRGALDYHDLQPVPDGEEDNPALSNRAAFLREVKGDDEAPENLMRALDTFVLAGAIKLFRSEQRPDLKFRHHTMLIHTSRIIADQGEDVARTYRLLMEADYQGGKGWDRLRKLWETDFVPVSSARNTDLPMPEDFEELSDHIGEALRRIFEGDPVIAVNSSDEGRDPDFVSSDEWTILVGGDKLSRGYTIEGLTVSYFRRRTGAGDSLMQMGRWFGYRPGYSDLVRLFIGTEEEASDGTTVDLWEAFESQCRAEEDFRRFVAASYSDGLTPIQLAPLVNQYLDWLPPTAANKRFNAWRSSANLAGEFKESDRYPSGASAKRSNLELLEAITSGSTPRRVTLSVRDDLDRSYSRAALVATLTPDDILRLLDEFTWAPGVIDRPSSLTELESYLKGHLQVDPEIDSWILYAPVQRSSLGETYPIWDKTLPVSRRSRRGGDTDPLVVASDSRDRLLMQGLTATLPAGYSAEASIQDLWKPRQGALLLRLSREPKEPSADPTFGHAFLPPGNSSPKHSSWSVSDAYGGAFTDQR